MSTNFEIVATSIHHLGNKVFAEEVLVGCLTSQLSTNNIQRFSENEVYLHCDATDALLEMI